MDIGNKTALEQCKFLHDGYFLELHKTFLDAFADYVIPFALTEVQFKNHIRLTDVDLSRTVGCLEREKLVGFSLNAFGQWQGKRTVYDAGTGVVPDRRRRGLSKRMFDFMLPTFKENGIEQFLLEVVTTNIRAVGLYEKLGFAPVRKLALLQCDGLLTKKKVADSFELREIDNPNWEIFGTFWDVQPSWQNSVDAVIRSRKLKRIIGAFENDQCLGYIVYSQKVGRIAQIAVDKSHRKSGVGTALVHKVREDAADGFSLQVINIDKSIEAAMNFFLTLGFYERLRQHEMIMQI